MELGATQEDGHSLKWHLDIVYEQSGVMPEALDVPECPVELMYLWAYFCAMSAKRTSGAMLANPLSDEQIMAWERRNRISLTPFEGECIDALDGVYLAQGGAKKQSISKK